LYREAEAARAVAEKTAAIAEEARESAAYAAQRADALRATAELARDEAEGANKAKASFLMTMSHEFRTPLGVVLGYVGLLCDELSGPVNVAQKQQLGRIETASKHLLALIDEILTLSRGNAGHGEARFEDVDLAAALSDAHALLAPMAQAKRLVLTLEVPDRPVVTASDGGKFRQIVFNLVGNAIKNTNAGAIRLRLSVEGNEVLLRVSDTGVGISPEAQTRIFEEFSQADGSTTRKHGGSGLGLAISKQLVQMMGGDIHVESALGAGSTFWFTLRLEKQDRLPEAAPMGLLTGVRALIVESNALNRSILTSQISAWGMTLRVAATPQQAIELLSQAAARGARYDLAIIDLGVPGVDALQLARTIRSRADIGKMRLVMLTRRQADVRDARIAGIDACLAKPVRQTMLYECLVNVMAGQPQETVAAPAPRGPESALPMETRGDILLVEDNLINQQVALGMLQMLGYNVVVVGNGVEALDAHAHGSFDLILMDCHMPEMDGFEATREIRTRERAASRPRMPIIALTANAMAHDREECLNAGMDDHLAKPFSMQTLQEMLQRWMPAAAPADAASPAVPAKTVNGADVIDRQVLEQLRKVVTNGKPELLERVVKLYLTESPKLIQKMKQAAGAADTGAIASSAHSLKSSSANVGAMALSRYCADIEACARRAQTEEARRLLERIEAEHGSVQTALAAEVEQLSTAGA
jgi:signal transduction histidine kinase/DNA-binding response OmpR family regulator